MSRLRSVSGTAIAAALACACTFAPPRGPQAADILIPPVTADSKGAEPRKAVRPLAAPRTPAGANVAIQPPPAYVANSYVGSLRVSVAWPAEETEATASFKTQAVPFSTNALIIRVFAPGAKTPVVPLAVVVRPDGGGRSEAQIDGIPAGNNYSVDIEAFRERDPLVASPTLVARGASSVNILPSVVSPADIELVPSFVPIIKAVSSTLASPGDILTITGQNFGAIGNLAPIVTFNGTAASISVSATPIDDGTIQVQVPKGAAVGRFAVSNDGIPFVSNSVVWVPSRLDIQAPIQKWQGRNLNPGQLYYGTSLRFEAGWAWTLSPGATESLYGVAPAPVWTSSAPKVDPRTGQPVNSVDQVGEFRAAAVRTLTDVTARLG
ncbi:MAG: IPT/TIG domain-containing protein, partial [Candidatus Sericytochromatia bacterium]|nr:IPT/TIG domain-containing protein [Candidatus Tanganyikabacteria bacterium]